MFEDFEPGSDIRLTVTKKPASEAARDTIRRLLLSSHEQQKASKKAADHRRRHADWRTRAGRPWNNRPRIPRVFHARPGETSTIRYRPQLAPDLQSVAEYLTIEKA